MAVNKKINKKIEFRFSLMNVLFLAAVLLPFLFSFVTILSGHIPFWYDPARDLLLAWDNLRKPALIGPPTGIPGIFYGPYWIWFLSIGLMISKDPRLVVFLVLTLPYFTIVPLILWRFAKNIFDKATITIIWVLFILSYAGYTSQIWNPHLAPLIFFALIYVVTKIDAEFKKKQAWAYVFVLGLLQGLLLNFHISFGLGIFLSTVIFFAIQLIVSIKNEKQKTNLFIRWTAAKIVYGAGIAFMFIPTLLFEMRHGFNQIKSLLFTLNQAFVHQTAVVGQIGLSQQQILKAFAGRTSSLLRLPQSISLLIFIILIGWVGFDWIKNKRTIKQEERNLTLFLFTAIIGILTVYVTSKNPVWDYHFIGTEVILAFFLGLLMKHNQLLKKIVGLWACVLLVLSISSFVRSTFAAPRYSGLSAEKADVENILKDAGGHPFAYSAKNAAIYTYDYDYLFRWLGKKYSLNPQNEIKDSALVYLIIPPELLSDKVGFVENRTPEIRYKTTREWKGTDGVLIIKREINKEQQ